MQPLTYQRVFENYLYKIPMLLPVQLDVDSYKRSLKKNLVFLSCSDHLLYLRQVSYFKNKTRNIPNLLECNLYRFSRSILLVELIATNARVCSCGDTADL